MAVRRRKDAEVRPPPCKWLRRSARGTDANAHGYVHVRVRARACVFAPQFEREMLQQGWMFASSASASPSPRSPISLAPLSSPSSCSGSPRDDPSASPLSPFGSAINGGGSSLPMRHMAWDVNPTRASARFEPRIDFQLSPRNWREPISAGVPTFSAGSVRGIYKESLRWAVSPTASTPKKLLTPLGALGTSPRARAQKQPTTNDAL